jgi:hypothetical protein
MKTKKQDFECFSTDDLKDMRGKIDEIIEKRDKEKKDEAWNNLVQAMIEYCEISGDWIDFIIDGESQIFDADHIKELCETTGIICLD